MAADPFVAEIKVVPVDGAGNPRGKLTKHKCTFTDIAAEKVTYGDSGDNRLYLPERPGVAGYAIADFVVPAGDDGEDCTNIDVYLNTKKVDNWVYGSNLSTTVGRSLEKGSALMVKPGNLELIQRA